MIKGTHHLKDSCVSISYEKTGVSFTKAHSKKIAKALYRKAKTRAHKLAISRAMRRFFRTGKHVKPIEKHIKELNTPLKYLVYKLKTKLAGKNRFRFMDRKETILNFIKTHKRMPYKLPFHNYSKLLNWSKKEIKLHKWIIYFKRNDSGYDPRFVRQMNTLCRKVGIKLNESY